jgi:prevent-host-death family protein
MRYSTQIKPISYFKAHTKELLDWIRAKREPIIITQRGEARAALVDIQSYDQAQESVAMLKILAAGDKLTETGETDSSGEVNDQIRTAKSGHHAKKAAKSNGSASA